MKFTSYTKRIEGTTAYVFAGKAVDLDLQGGLEETLNELINNGARRIVLTLRGMRFLHSTLFSTLLAIQSRLEGMGGDLILSETPWFVLEMLHDIGVLHRFAVVPDETVVVRAEAMVVDLNSSAIPG